MDMAYRKKALIGESDTNSEVYFRIPSKDELKTIQAISQALNGLSFEDVEFILAKVREDLPRGAVYRGIVCSLP